MAFKLGKFGCVCNGDGIGSVVLLRNIYDTCDVILGCKLVDGRNVLYLFHDLSNDRLRNNCTVITLCEIGFCSVLDTDYCVSNVICERLNVSLLDSYILLDFSVFHTVSFFLSFNGFINVIDFGFKFVKLDNFFARHRSFLGFCGVKQGIHLFYKINALFFKTLNVHFFLLYLHNVFIVRA